MVRDQPFTVGVEEEYLLVDPGSRNLVHTVPKELLRECELRVGGQVTPEFLQSQIEVGTRVCDSVSETRSQLTFLRRTVSEIARDYGMEIIASSTHPFAYSGDQRTTDKERYQILARDFQGVARRLVISGMHVHVGIADEDLRVDLMTQARYFLPHLLALSTSSPFWEGQRTGLMSYRIAVWDEMPRTGLPEAFESYGEYERHVRALVEAGVLEDATKIWWDIRPSARFPTLEMRITDVCTRVDDAVCISALYVCWLHMLFRLRRTNLRWRRYSAMLISENRWLAQRYGLAKGLVDFGEGRLVPYAELVEEILALLADDARELECEAEVAHVRTILARGTSADLQLRVYEEARAQGASEQEALCAVVDVLIHETMRSCEPPKSA